MCNPLGDRSSPLRSHQWFGVQAVLPSRLPWRDEVVWVIVRLLNPLMLILRTAHVLARRVDNVAFVAISSVFNRRQVGLAAEVCLL